jgi:hypothetical protein
MSHLTMDDLPEHERADVAKAKAMLDPYVQIAAVDWTSPKETPP